MPVIETYHDATQFVHLLSLSGWTVCGLKGNTVPVSTAIEDVTCYDCVMENMELSLWEGGK